jgi:hypothetical protein
MKICDYESSSWTPYGFFFVEYIKVHKKNWNDLVTFDKEKGLMKQKNRYPHFFNNFFNI